MATDNGPSRDVSPSKNSFDKKTRGESFDEAMNAPNTPRPAKSPRPDCPTDSQGFFDRSKESYNVTYDYCDDED